MTDEQKERVRVPGKAPTFYFATVSGGFLRLIATTAMTMSTTTIASTPTASFMTVDIAIGSVSVGGTSLLAPIAWPSLM